MIKYSIRLAFLVLCFACASSIALAKHTPLTLDSIIVTVNDLVITKSELDHAIATVEKQLASTNTPRPPQDTLRKQVLDQLISRKLQMQIAEQAGINVTDDQVSKTVTHIASENHLTTAELYQKVVEHGLSQADYRKEIHDQITLNQIQQQEVGTKITVTPQEVKDFTRSKEWQASNTKEYHLEDILITLPETPSAQDVATAKKHADALVAKLHQGLSFKSAAVAESGDDKALEGGDLGWRKLPEVPTAFADPLINAKANDILGPIQAPNGFHIIHLAGIRDASSHGSAEQQQKQIEQYLYQRKFEEALQSWTTKLRGEAVINTQQEG